MNKKRFKNTKIKRETLKKIWLKKYDEKDATWEEDCCEWERLTREDYLKRKSNDKIQETK